MIKGQLVMGCNGSISMQFDGSVTMLPGQTYNITLEQAPDLQELRRLRLYHWKQVCKLADSLCSNRGTEAGRENWRAQHKMHMRAVQALNDLFPVGDTAERDMERQLASVRLR